jgi:hypothetical protein
VVPLQVGGTCRICVYEKRSDGMALKQVAEYATFTLMIKGTQ